MVLCFDSVCRTLIDRYVNSAYPLLPVLVEVAYECWLVASSLGAPHYCRVLFVFSATRKRAQLEQNSVKEGLSGGGILEKSCTRLAKCMLLCLTFSASESL